MNNNIVGYIDWCRNVRLERPRDVGGVHADQAHLMVKT